MSKSIRVASKRTVGSQGIFYKNVAKHDINPKSIVTKKESNKLSKVQQKKKMRKLSRKSRMFNLLHK